MRAGRLDRRIELQTKTVMLDSWGDETETWATLGLVWAGLVGQAAAEAMIGAERVAAHTDIFEIRWRADLGPLNRLIYHDRI